MHRLKHLDLVNVNVTFKGHRELLSGTEKLETLEVSGIAEEFTAPSHLSSSSEIHLPILHTLTLCAVNEATAQMILAFCCMRSLSIEDLDEEDYIVSAGTLWNDLPHRGLRP